MDEIQYFVTDSTATPPSFAHYFTERLVYMPHSYFVNDYRHSSRTVIDHPEKIPRRKDYFAQESNISEDCILLANFGQLSRIDPETLNVWCNILKRVPNSVLWLLRQPALGEAYLRKEFQSRDIDDQTRIVFTDPTSKENHILRIPVADLVLDTPLRNSHTVSADILWAGVPIITVPGEKMANRVTASLLHNNDGKELITKDWIEYEELAVSMCLQSRNTRVFLLHFSSQILKNLT